MANRLQKTPVLVYAAAVPAIPDIPAYCETVQVRGDYTGTAIRIGGGSIGGGSSGGDRVSTGANSSTEAGAISTVTTPVIPDGWSGTSVPFSPMRPDTRSVQICYPAVPGRAAIPVSLSSLANDGWNGGARSIAHVPDPGFFRCSLPVPRVAVQIGLTDSAFDHSYSHMSHAVVIRPGTYTVIESGVTVQAAQPYEEGAVLEVRRANGVVAFYLDDALAYRSETPSAGTRYAGVVLYSPTDSVDAPVIGLLGQAAGFVGALPEIQFLGADRNVALVDARLPAISLRAQMGLLHGAMTFKGQLPRLAMLGSDRDVAVMRGALPGIQGRAEMGQPEAQIAGLTAIIPPVRLSGLSLSGGGMSFSALMPSVLHFKGADRPVCEMRAIAPIRLALAAFEPYMPAGQIDGSEAAYLADNATLESALLLLAMDSLDVGSTAAELIVVLELQGMDRLSLTDEQSLGSLIEMLAMEQVAINSVSDAAQQEALQYAINTLTGAATRYEGFDFHGFATVGGTTYGWRPDGLYRVGENAPDALIRALVDFGTTDYGDSHVKRMDMAFMGLRSDGECYLRVRADEGPERVYHVCGHNSVRRAPLAKGVSGRHWSLRLDLVDASFITLDSIEVSVGASSRRTISYRS